MAKVDRVVECMLSVGGIDKYASVSAQGLALEVRLDGFKRSVDNEATSPLGVASQ